LGNTVKTELIVNTNTAHTHRERATLCFSKYRLAAAAAVATAVVAVAPGVAVVHTGREIVDSTAAAAADEQGVVH
jgi:hypothetical protein